MANMSTAQILRVKIIGAKLREARISKGKELGDCAQAIGLSSQEYEAYELGEKFISLPELESLCYFLKLPLGHFLSGEPLTEPNEKKPIPIDSNQLIQIRQRMVGAKVRQARLENQLDLNELCQQINVDPSTMTEYELGQKPIPIPVLENISGILNRSMREFQDEHGPVGTWDAQQRAIKGFLELPPEMQAFVSKPVNQPYLELAQRLSHMSVDRLRAVAEGLLEITY